MYKKTILKMAIHKEGENPVFECGVIHIELQDEAAGAFFKIEEMTEKQQSSSIRLEPDMIDVVFETCKELLSQKHVYKG